MIFGYYWFVVVLSVFGLFLSYCGVWFVGLLQRGVIRHFVAAFYLFGGDSNKQNEFDQSNISNYDRQYVEKQES